MSLLARLRYRRALHLKQQEGAPPVARPKAVAPVSYMTTPEREHMERANADTVKTFEDLSKESRSADHFGGTIPTVKTIVNLAQLGSPARGEYKRTLDTVKSLFGHDPDGVTAWQLVNGSLSPRAEYLDHAGASTLIVANWLALGKPKDPDAIRELIYRVNTFGKHYTPELAAKVPWAINPKTGKYAGIAAGEGETFGGTTAMGANVERAVRALSNVEKLRDTLVDPAGDPGRNLALISSKGLGKVNNFIISYSAPTHGTALDMWMSHLLFHPSLDNIEQHSDVLSQVKSQLSDPSELTEIERKAAKHYPVRSELVRALLKQPNAVVNITRRHKDGTTSQQPIKIHKFLQELNSALVTDQPVYMAFKHGVADAAKRLDWSLSEVQESVWTGVIAIAAAVSLGIPINKIQDYLTYDTVRKGWQNHEAFVFPGLVDAYRRAGTDPAAVRQLQQRTLETAASHSRPGVIPVSDPAHLRRIAAYIPPAGRRDAATPIRDALVKRLTEEGLIDPKTGQVRLRRLGQKLRLAQYDLPVDFVSALSRAVSTDQQTFADHLRHVLQQSGIQPHEVSPAVHDYAGQARASVVAAGSFRGGQQFPHTGAAWTGLLGRQPGMLSFQGNANGPDSVYRFQHNDADQVRQVLDQAGIKSRVLAPHDKTFHIFVYDAGRRNREGMARALTLLGTPAEEWRGTGTPIGGKEDDMGREQYRGVINTAEAAGGPVQMAFGSVFRGGNYAAAHPAPLGVSPWNHTVPKHYDALNAWFEKNKKPVTYYPRQTGTNEVHVHEEAKIGNNRIMHRDPDDGSLHIRLHTTDVVTAHPDGTYTLRAGSPGFQHVGWRTPLTHGTQAYFAPNGASWKMPGFFNGIRIDSQGRPLHTISGKYNDNLLKMIQEVHMNPSPENKTALNVAIRMLAPSWQPTKRPDTIGIPRMDRGQAATLHGMLEQRGYDPDSPAAAELADLLYMGDKPYTAHAVRALHGRTDYEETPLHHYYRPLVYGEVGGVPVELHTPVNQPGQMMDPRWRAVFGMGPRPATEYPYKVPIMSYVPQEIGRGILHEIDRQTIKNAVMNLRYKNALKTYPHPGGYRFPNPGV